MTGFEDDLHILAELLDAVALKAMLEGAQGELGTAHREDPPVDIGAADELLITKAAIREGWMDTPPWSEDSGLFRTALIFADDGY